MTLVPLLNKISFIQLPPYSPPGRTDWNATLVGTLGPSHKFLRLNGLANKSKALPVVAATINGIALRIADIAESRLRWRLDRDELFVQLWHDLTSSVYAYVCHHFCCQYRHDSNLLSHPLSWSDSDIALQWNSCKDPFKIQLSLLEGGYVLVEIKAPCDSTCWVLILMSEDVEKAVCFWYYY